MSVATDINGAYSIPEAADELNVTPSLVRRWVRAGVIKAEKLGERVYLIRKSKLDEFKKSRRKPGRPADVRSRRKK